MSVDLYDGIAGLRFWTEDEINLREAFTARCADVVRRTLLAMNPAWRFARCEGPILTPRDRLSAEYSDDEVFPVTWEKGARQWALRPETTASSYAYARSLGGKLPLCVWQAGKSFRVEKNDGASAAKMRFNEFWQLEFQCIYSAGSSADYRKALISAVQTEITRFTGLPTSTVASDRLPSYSESTLDIEVFLDGGMRREMASCSIRTDYAENARVCEIAIGLDRVATLAAEMAK